MFEKKQDHSDLNSFNKSAQEIKDQTAFYLNYFPL